MITDLTSQIYLNLSSPNYLIDNYNNFGYNINRISQFLLIYITNNNNNNNYN